MRWILALLLALQSALALASSVKTSGPPFTGDSGTGGVQGLVPAPPTHSAQYGDYLSANGSFAYVDQSYPIYTPFTLTKAIASQVTGTKYQTIATWVGIDGNKTYAAVGSGGGLGTIFIYDITNPRNPTYISTTTLAGTYNFVPATIGGANYLIVPSSGSSVLYIENVTNPAAVTTTGSLTISGSPGALYAVAYSNNCVYLATQNKGLTVVDINGCNGGTGTLATPVQTYQEGGTTNKTAGVAINGNYVYTTNYQTTFPATVRYLKTWELAAGGGTPSVPFLANTYTLGCGATATSTKPEGVSVAANGLTAFVTDSNQANYCIVDLTTPTSPSVLSYVNPTYSAIPDNTLAVAQSVGNVLYLPSGGNATNGGAIDLVDITNRSSPIKVSTVYNYDASSSFGNITLLNGYIFAADYGTASTNSYLDVFAGANPIIATTLTGSTLSVTTPISVASGGTGLTTLTANNVILGNGTSAPTFVAPGTSGNVLLSNGTTWTSAAAPAGGLTAPTQQFFTSSGTYTLPTNPTPLWIEVQLIGAGGGGGGGGTTGASAGGAGGSSVFGSLTCTGGGGGSTAAGSALAAGGSCSGTLGAGFFANGGAGNGGASYNLTAYTPGQAGAASVFGGNGGGQANGLGSSAVTNSGSGGAGGGCNNSGPAGGGGGGGAGGYVYTIISSPASTYTVTIGAGGLSANTSGYGTAGTYGFQGGTGGSGFAHITEHYY